MATTSESGQVGQIFIRRSSGLTRQVSAWDALAYACLGPGWLWPFLYSVWIPWLYPGAHIPFATLAIVLFFPIAGVYWFYSIAMPRSGGEYVYVSRTLHPALGLLCSFACTFVSISWVGAITDWMVRWGIADFPRSVGIIYGDPAWTAAADFIAQPTTRTVIGTASIFLGTLVIFKGARWMMRVSWVAVVAAAIGVLTMIVAVIIGAGNFAGNWTAMTGIDYNTIIPESTKIAGYTTEFGFIATLMAGSTYVGLNTLGATYSANIAGEVRGVQRSQLLALFGSLIVLMIVWFLLYQLLYIGVGATWLGSLDALFGSGSAAYPFGANEPFSTLLVGIMTANPVWPFILSAMFTVTAFGAATAVAFAPTRNMFAWAFDRMIPPKFSEIGERTKQPWLVITAAMVCGWAFYLIQVWEPVWMANQGYAIMVWFFAWMVLGIAGVVFPYMRPNLFRTSPPIVMSKFLGIPVITWFGALTFLVSASIEYYMLVPIFEGRLPLEAIYIVGAFIVIPIILYFASSVYFRSRGVPIAMQFNEVPPE